MKRLVIAEKPSVGRTIAKVLGASDERDGYIEGREYLISWCVGHLAGLASPESYDERYTKWRRDDLPIIPSDWKLQIPGDKRGQFALLKRLLERDDVSEIVNACDAGREGELIFRDVYSLSGCRKPTLRLWVNSLEDDAIRRGFENLRPGSEYDALYTAAVCRDRADWLVGINMTRLFSVLYHRKISVGRVVSPTLAMITAREAEIQSFKPERFYKVALEFGGFCALSEKTANPDDAGRLAEKCGKAVVTDIARTEKSKKAPALYDLTTLQRDANRVHGFTAKQTLDYAHSLYEKKFITYPRSDSRCLTDDMESGVAKTAARSAEILGTPVPETILSQQVCDSAKVSDHHAIIPTLSGENILPDGEAKILRMIAARTLEAVSGPFTYEETVCRLTCADAEFTAKGKKIINRGWRAFASATDDVEIPSEIVVGSELVPENISVRDGMTTPPKRFTEDTLLAAMETAGQGEMPDDAERSGIGTPATRAEIIEKLISGGSVVREKSKKTVNLVPTDQAIKLAAILPERLKSPILTAEWEEKLSKIRRGEIGGDEFMSEVNLMVNELMKTSGIVSGAELLFPSVREKIGVCPRCGWDVTESKKGFFCEKNGCRFGLWRDNRFLTALKIVLTRKMAAELLKSGRVHVSNLFSEKSGKSFDAMLVMNDDGEKTLYSLDFARKEQNGKSA